MFFFLAAIGLLMYKLSGAISGGEQPDPGIFLGSFAVLFPLHLFAMFCSFYCLYFVAMTFKAVELQRETAFLDFVGEFFDLVLPRWGLDNSAKNKQDG